MFYLGLFVTCLLAYVQNGSALRCWACSSDLDPSCMDYFNTTKMLQQRSYYQQINTDSRQYQRNDMPTLVECTNNLGQIYGQKQVCVKRILNVPYGKKIISRECKSVSTQQASGTCPEKNTNVEFCEYCEYDGCNAATGLKVNLAAVALPIIAIVTFLRR